VQGNEKTVDKIADMLYKLDGAFSPYNGEVEKLNRNGGGEMSEDVCDLLAEAVEYQWKTGVFHPWLGSVIELWGIGEKNYIPTDAEISDALSSAGIYNGESDGKTIKLTNGAKLNFGAIAKGYATDKIREILKADKVKSAMISLGGNVYVHGKKPDGSLWRVGLRNPAGKENDWFCTLELEDKFVISSGDYERYFERDGKRYHHIFDPRTGKPAESDLVSVTVISDSGARGDAYSTALYIMGEEKALSFWRENGNFELVLVCRDGRVVLTEGVSDCFEENREAGYTYETAHR
jgi:thiamine biosynthesis lipoprotein